MYLQSSSMKILYIANIRMPTERAHGAQIMKMCEAFTMLGHTVTLAVPTRHTHIKDDAFEYHGITKKFRIVRLLTLDVVFWGWLGFWLEQWWFAKVAFLYAIFSGADIIYSRDVAPLFLLSFVKSNLVWESHRGEYNVMVRWLFRRVRRVVVISEGLKNFYIYKDVQKEKIVVAHDGYDPTQFENVVSREESRQQLGLSKDAIIIMYIGSLDDWKGYRVFLEASQLLKEFLFVVIGGKSKQVDVLRIEFPRVQFLGEKPYKELPVNQQAADILVIPNTEKDVMSAKFTSPLKVFAHMASGVPIVASDVPSLREVLSKYNSVLVEPDNSQALADGIKECMEEKESSHKRALQAKADVVQYSWKKRTDLILNVLKHD
jgi:glycosyltransferase involved in cell wall biosynthesis